MLIWHKNFFFAIFEYGYQSNAELYADFETVEKNVKNLLTKKLQPKQVWKIRGSPLLQYTTKLQKCLANNFFWVDFFFDYFHRFEISVKFCEFWILICQKRTKKIWGHWVHIWVYVRTNRMQIRKKWLNQLKTFFSKHF